MVKKFVWILAVLAVLLMVLSGCSQQTEGRITSAKVRFFDGSMDTIEIDRFSIADGFARLTAKDGRHWVIGVNNVIIVNESEDQYHCREESE